MTHPSRSFAALSLVSSTDCARTAPRGVLRSITTDGGMSSNSGTTPSHRNGVPLVSSASSASRTSAPVVRVNADFWDQRHMG